RSGLAVAGVDGEVQVVAGEGQAVARPADQARSGLASDRLDSAVRISARGSCRRGPVQRHYPVAVRTRTRAGIICQST
ncbi:MAG: hypothetical protein NTY02_20445, partial [Acidobacteria bacterium]|nr:hypothetical protein [Acidobacteriota bacterium]